MDSLIEIKKYAEEIAGQWNGDESGRAEDRAGIAGDILIKIDELNKLLAELEDF
jgi:hypothetical protein